MQLLLASASPARAKTLQAAGIKPLIAVSHVPEAQLLADLHAQQHNPSPAAQVQLLATAKARDIAQKLTNKTIRRETEASLENEEYPRVIIGCDSMFSFAGEVTGKPHSIEIARKRLREMSGKYGDLYTGHCLIDTLTGKETQGVSCARVYISQISPAEIEAYLNTGEPLAVAGSFTIDGFGGPFIEKIEGDHHGIVGISLPLLRKLLQKLDLNITDFWH